jgi:DNA-binding transcriptional regulator GbsR (MarR family)
MHYGVSLSEKRLEDGKKRHDFQSNHGFHKWFKTQCELAGMKSINIEILMVILLEFQIHIIK